MMYRIAHHLISIPSQMYLTPATTRTTCTRGHDQKFQTPFSRIQCHQDSYFPSAIRTWHSLPAVLISVPTIEAFKVKLVHVHMCRHSHHIYIYICKYYIFKKRNVFNHTPPCRRNVHTVLLLRPLVYIIPLVWLRPLVYIIPLVWNIFAQLTMYVTFYFILHNILSGGIFLI